jgi:hypothetical protein
VRFPARLAEPQGGVLSVSDDHVRSGGHKKAAGPMVVEALTLAKLEMSRP